MNSLLNNFKNWLSVKMALLYGNYFSLDKIFKKNKAIANICFVEDQDKNGGSIKLEINGMVYFFEVNPTIEEYKNLEGKNVIKKTLKYGGWEMDMTHLSNKIF